ncbi:uncharacterized protein NPIL_88011 [Nephila pilipes]|uniref:Uncharacterized protein n=1 Tax=Nephila pilipes TaxID=299642 RepID=A0A8X6U0B7_NEPPI|nr:uncharacterized protein NPIL_88011 [Nephila pilipes]
MDTCADIACICGNHECSNKFQRDAIKDLVYKPDFPKTEHQEKYIKFAYEQPTKSLKPYYLNWINEVGVPDSHVQYCSHHQENSSLQSQGRHLKSYYFKDIRKNEEPNYNIKHPTHTHSSDELCGHHEICCNCKCQAQTCGHGPYIPASSPLQKPVCHPDRPNIVGILKSSKPDSKNCSECSEIFSCSKRSLWEKPPIDTRKEDVLEECHDLCGNIAKIEGGCCRCCTCRGCPTCKKDYCHPCSFSYGRAGAGTNCKYCRVPFSRDNESDLRCEKHPRGCYFIPNPDT